MNISLNVRINIEIKYKNLRIKSLIFSYKITKSLFWEERRASILRLLEVPGNTIYTKRQANKQEVVWAKNAKRVEEGALQWALNGQAGFLEEVEIEPDYDEREGARKRIRSRVG